MYFFTISSLFFDYAEVQRKNTQSFVALLVGMLSLLMFNKLLVGGVGLQLAGVGVASSTGLFLQMIVIVGLNWSDIFGSNRQENVEFCGSDTFFGIGQRFTESAKSCILNLGALYAFELCVLIASKISPNAFAAQVILMQLTIIFLALPYGIGTVAHDLISDSLNFGETLEAKATGEIFQSFSILVGIISVTIAAIFRKDLLNLYTSD